MVIGIVIHFFDFRNDVRELIHALLQDGHNVVVFYKADQRQQIMNHPIAGAEYREIKEQYRSWRNRIWEYLFLFFKKIPKSRNNYFLMELFKITNSPLRKRISISDAALWVQKLGINFIHYDTLLKNLKPTRKTDFSDIDKLFAFTEFPCDYLAARLVQDNIPFQVYVYSWDHPCKHTRFSKFFKYITWSDATKDDLVHLQGIAEKNIRVIGSTQFVSIYNYIHEDKSKSSPYPYQYLYYCCAIGIRSLVVDEILVIIEILKLLERKYPQIKLVVRPYPLVGATEIYEDLKKYSNIVFDDEFMKNNRRGSKDMLFAKFVAMENALAVLHTGSTIGLEASFLRSPSLLIDFGYSSKKGISLYNFIHQHQNDKYLTSTGNVVKSISDLDALISSEFSSINNVKVSEKFSALGIDSIINNMLSHEN